MVAQGDNLSSAIQECGALIVLGQGIFLDRFGLFSASKVVLSNLERLPFSVLLVLTEDMRQCSELRLTAVGEDTHAGIFMHAKWSSILDSHIMSATVIISLSHRFDKNTLSINLILPTDLISFLFFKRVLWSLRHCYVDIVLLIIIFAP